MVQKVAGGRELEPALGHLTTGKLSLLPSCKWVFLSNEGKIRQRKKRDELHLLYAVHKIQGGL